jgi:hypothetical protein
VNGDLKEAIQTLAASNVRLIDIAKAADRMLDATLEYQRHPSVRTEKALQDAIDHYEVVRQGS